MVQTSKKQWKRGKGKAAADEDGQDEGELAGWCLCNSWAPYLVLQQYTGLADLKFICWATALYRPDGS